MAAALPLPPSPCGPPSPSAALAAGVAALGSSRARTRPPPPARRRGRRSRSGLLWGRWGRRRRGAPRCTPGRASRARASVSSPPRASRPCGRRGRATRGCSAATPRCSRRRTPTSGRTARRRASRRGGCPRTATAATSPRRPTRRAPATPACCGGPWTAVAEAGTRWRAMDRSRALPPSPCRPPPRGGAAARRARGPRPSRGCGRLAPVPTTPPRCWTPGSGPPPSPTSRSLSSTSVFRAGTRRRSSGPALAEQRLLEDGPSPAPSPARRVLLLRPQSLLAPLRTTSTSDGGVRLVLRGIWRSARGMEPASISFPYPLQPLRPGKGYWDVPYRTLPVPGADSLITSSKFVHGRENDLTVVFWDKTELKATLLRREWAFCLLATDVNTNCRAIDLLEGDDGLDNSRTFMHVPLGHTRTRFEFTYAICKSLESYPVLKPKDMVPVSDEFFMVSCNYFDKTSRGVNRLTGAPVFGTGNAAGRTVGIILQDCRLEDAGCEFKVALTASHLLKLIWILLDSPEEKNHNLSGGEKRKAAKKNHDLSGGKKRKATKSP